MTTQTFPTTTYEQSLASFQALARTVDQSGLTLVTLAATAIVQGAALKQSVAQTCDALRALMGAVDKDGRKASSIAYDHIACARTLVFFARAAVGATKLATYTHADFETFLSTRQVSSVSALKRLLSAADAKASAAPKPLANRLATSFTKGKAKLSLPELEKLAQLIQQELELRHQQEATRKLLAGRKPKAKAQRLTAKAKA